MPVHPGSSILSPSGSSPTSLVLFERGDASPQTAKKAAKREEREIHVLTHAADLVAVLDSDVGRIAVPTDDDDNGTVSDQGNDEHAEE